MWRVDFIGEVWSVHMFQEEQRRHKMQMEAQNEEAEKKMRQLAAEKQVMTDLLLWLSLPCKHFQWLWLKHVKWLISQMLEVEVSASRRREELAAEAKV